MSMQICIIQWRFNRLITYKKGIAYVIHYQAKSNYGGISKCYTQVKMKNDQYLVALFYMFLSELGSFGTCLFLQAWI